MRVRMKSIMSGPTGSYQPGQEVDFDEKTAKGLVAGGFAEPVKASAERAVKSPAETATGRGGQAGAAVRAKAEAEEKAKAEAAAGGKKAG